MSEGAVVPAQGSSAGADPATRGRRALSFVSPGLPQLLDGRWRVGVPTLLVWVGLLTVLASRTTRVVDGLGGAWDQRLAILTLLVGLAGVWFWSWRDVVRPSPIRGEGLSQPLLVARAFFQNQVAVVGLAVILGLYLVALIAPLITPADPTLPGHLVDDRLLRPSATHLFGTDHLSRDVLSRLLYGARISLTIGLVAVGISVTIGTLLGAIAGYVGGAVDSVIMRGVDVVISFPRVVILITVLAFFGSSFLLMIMVLGLTLWPNTARLVRGETLSLRERQFIKAAEALGYSKLRIILRHVIPNVMGPVIVAATLGIGDTIILESGLSFLGLGVSAPTPSWGSMIADGRDHMFDAWWLTTFPGLCIVLTVLSFNLIGDGLRDALDPHLRS